MRSIEATAVRRVATQRAWATMLDVSASQKKALLEVDDPVIHFNEISRILGK